MNSGEKPAQQARSRAAREKIVCALDTLLRDQAFDKVTVAALAKEAGVAVGTVYQRFKNKEALLPVLLEIYQKHLEDWMAGSGRIELDADDDLRSALRKVFRHSWKLLKREAHLLRAVHLHVRLNPEIASGTAWQAYEDASQDSIRQILDYFRAEVRRQDIATATAFACYFFNSIMIEKGLFEDEAPGTLFKPKGQRFADQCADTLYGYLVTPELA